ELGLRFHPCRGSMSLGRSKGGLPPDSAVEEHDEILAHTEAVANRYHDAARGSMCRVVVAPCSPFSVTPALMEESAELARRLGLGVDGAASNEDSNLAFEVHQALLLARARETSPQALDARGAWRLATQGGAQCLGRDDCGTLEAGKCADVACFRIDDLAHAGSADAVAALALAAPGRAQAVIVDGHVVVREGRLLTADEETIARELAATSARLRGA